MCRILGRKSKSLLSIVEPLVTAENSISHQSPRNPDSWGVGWYENGETRIEKAVGVASESLRFYEIGRGVQTCSLLAHIRRASVGAVEQVNCHPFHYSRWMLVHNGTFEKTPEMRAELLRKMPPKLAANIHGTTDSELFFHTFLHLLQDHYSADLDALDIPAHTAAKALSDALLFFHSEAKRLHADKISRFSLIVCNPELMLCVRGGPSLHYRKTHEAITLSSEPTDHATWTQLSHDTLLSIDSELHTRIEPLRILNQDEIAWLENYLQTSGGAKGCAD